MATWNPFEPDAFSLIALTAAINNIPYQPHRIASLGLFQERGIATLNIAIERRGESLGLVPITPRGSTGAIVTTKKSELKVFSIPHIQSAGTIMADEVMGIREFGSESQAKTVTSVRDQHLARMRTDIDYTIESHRLAAIMGNYYDVNGNLVSLFTEFGVTQQTVNMALATTTTSVITKIFEVLEKIESQLDGLSFTGVRVLCGTTFFKALIDHSSVRETYLGTQMASDLRGDPRVETTFGGVTWERYRGTSAVKIPDTEAYAIPMGVNDFCWTFFAPANYLETVNTIGLPYYVKSRNLDYDKGIEMEAQSNPLSICSRPSAIVKLTAS